MRLKKPPRGLISAASRIGKVLRVFDFHGWVLYLFSLLISFCPGLSRRSPGLFFFLRCIKPRGFSRSILLRKLLALLRNSNRRNWLRLTPSIAAADTQSFRSSWPILTDVRSFFRL